MWIAPICDRTQKDIDEGRSKAFCNVSDLNRIEDNCIEVAAIFGLSLRKRSTRWTVTDMPTASELNRILENICLIRQSYQAYQTTPQPPQSPMTHWKKWNDAERILMDIRGNYLDNRLAKSYSGEMITGERIGVL